MIAPRIATAALLIAALAASSLPSWAGDFGRPKPSILDGVFPPQFWKGPVTGYSSYPLTDIEEELRDRSYALIRPVEPRNAWNLVVASYRVGNWLSGPFKPYDYTAYGRELLWSARRSEASQYNQLIDDMNNEGTLLAAFITVACQVADLDIKRQRSLPYVQGLSPDEYENAIGRVDENRLITFWVRRTAYDRLASYRYALERFVIAVPSQRAIAAEQTLHRLEKVVAGLDPAFARCGGELGWIVPPPGKVPPALITK